MTVSSSRDPRHTALFGNPLSLAYAQQYASELPNARLEAINDACGFTPEDRPDRLADLIAKLVDYSGDV